MAIHIEINDSGDVVIPHELVAENSGVQNIDDGTIMIVYKDGSGNFTFKRVEQASTREYSDEDIAMFWEESRVDPDLKDRADRLLNRGRATSRLS